MSAVSSEVAADREAFASVAGTLDANVGDIVAQFLNAKSEYDAKFTEPPAEVYAQHALERVERKSKRGTVRTSLGEGGYKGAWISEYRSSSDKGRQAKSAVKNSRSDIRRRYSVAAADAAAAAASSATKWNVDAPEFVPSSERANDASASAPESKDDDAAPAAATLSTSIWESMGDTFGSSEYSSSYQEPDYLLAAEKAAAAAADAAVALRKLAPASEYAAQFKDGDTDSSHPPAGAYRNNKASPKQRDQVFACIDFDDAESAVQEAKAAGPSVKPQPRRVAWVSEYDAAFAGVSAAETRRAGAKTGKTNYDDVVGECLTQAADLTSSKEEKSSGSSGVPAVVSSGGVLSTYAADFCGISASSTSSAPVRSKIISYEQNSAGRQVAECMDWGEVKQADERIPRERLGAVLQSARLHSGDSACNMYSTYEWDYCSRAADDGEMPKPSLEARRRLSLVAADAAAAAETKGAATGEDDEWVLLEKPSATSEGKGLAANTSNKPKRAIGAPGWASLSTGNDSVVATTYDWDFNGKWKEIRQKAAKKQQSREAAKRRANKKKKSMSRSAIKASRNATLAGVRKASSRNPARESASHLYVADKTMPMFATQSSYQADVSTPAAKRMLAKEAVVEKQNIVREMLVAPAPVKFSGPVLRNRRYPESVHNKFMRTSYQAAFGSKRMAGLSARIKLRAAAERRAAQEEQ